jgi:hypothetical protein
MPDSEDAGSGGVLLVIGNDQCRLAESDVTWLAQELRVAHPAAAGPAPGRVVADRLELMLVGGRWGVLPLDRAEVEQVHAVLRGRVPSESPALQLLLDTLADRLSRRA